MSLPTLLNARSPLAPPAAQRAHLEALPLARTFRDAAASAGHAPLRPAATTTLQINVGKRPSTSRAARPSCTRGSGTSSRGRRASAGA